MSIAILGPRAASSRRRSASDERCQALGLRARPRSPRRERRRRRALAGAQFRDHPRGRRARAHELVDAVDVERGNRLALAVEHAGACRRRRRAALRLQPGRKAAGERIGVDVEQRAVARRADAGDHRDELLTRTAMSRAGHRQVGSGSPTRPRSTSSPLVARCGLAGLTGPTPASAPVSPTACPPAALIAATNRVLIDPASTATTTCSVASSVIRRPSTWCLGSPPAPARRRSPCRRRARRPACAAAPTRAISRATPSSARGLRAARRRA